MQGCCLANWGDPNLRIATFDDTKARLKCLAVDANISMVYKFTP